VEQNFYIQRIAKEVTHKELARQAMPLMNKIKKTVKKTYKEVFGEQDNLPDNIELMVKEMPKDKIGSYRYNDGVLAISPNAFEKGEKMVFWVIMHELAHGAIGNTQDSNNHGTMFQKFTTALGIPERYQD
jgi:predicted metal-dependent hydrolase